MAASQAMADGRIISLVLNCISDMAEKHRIQAGSEQTVELLIYLPNLAPYMLVNRLWHRQCAAIVWRNYPHLPALKDMDITQRQWYADKIERAILHEPSEGENLGYLEGLTWPRLKHLDLHIDLNKFDQPVASMLQAGVEHLELLGPQLTNSDSIASHILALIFGGSSNLRSIVIGPHFIDGSATIPSQVLSSLLDSRPSLVGIRIMNAAFKGKNSLFKTFSQRPHLKSLEIDLEPGLDLLPFLSKTPTPFFPSLKRLHIVCYPELALAMPSHLQLLEELHLSIGRMPDQSWQDSDISVLDNVVCQTSQCGHLQVLRISIGQLASDFPTARSFPFLLGSSLVKLAIGCPDLQDIGLFVSAPAAIDGSHISGSQFDSFCRQLPQLKSLALKLHPQTAIQLELTALQSLGMHCPDLEQLSLMMAVHLPSLSELQIHPPSLTDDDTLASSTCDLSSLPSTPSITISSPSDQSSLDPEYPLEIRLTRPLFPHLTCLAFARPQTILSLANDPYKMSCTSYTDATVDERIEEDLVRLWAFPLHRHFPQLIELEAWSDWTGRHNTSLKYILPLEDVLLSTHEFLSGIEQDIWDDDNDENGEDSTSEECAASYVHRLSFIGGHEFENANDWEKASQLNEFASEDSLNHSPQGSHHHADFHGMIASGRILLQ